MFLGVESTEVLVLSYNRIAEVESGPLSGLTNLTDLYLWSNSLTELASNMFTGLKSLESLILSHNITQTIEKGSFTGLIVFVWEQTDKTKCWYVF